MHVLVFYRLFTRWRVGELYCPTTYILLIIRWLNKKDETHGLCKTVEQQIVVKVHNRSMILKWNLCGKVQGRIKLFGAPRQWKHFRPLFQAVFLSGGVYYPPDWVKHHASQSQDRNNKYFILYIEFVAADLLFRLARMGHAWKGDCYLTVLVFSWQILFLLS